MLLTHGFQGPNTPHITSPASLDALTNPGLFLLQSLVEQRVLPLFLLQRFLFQIEVAIIGGRKTHQLAPVQLNDAGRHAPYERTIVADKQHGASELAKGLLQPGDCRNIQVVRGLVQQQYVRIGNQCLGQQNPALPTAGQSIQRLVRINAVLTENGGDFLVKAPSVQSLQALLNLHQPVETRLIGLLGQLMKFSEQLARFRKGTGDNFIGGTGIFRGQVLRKHRQHGPVIETNNATVGYHFPTDNLEQGRFSLAVSSQQTHALAGIDNQ